MTRQILHNRVNRRELKERLRASAERRLTLSFYRYVRLKNPAFFRDHLYGLFAETGVLGRVYVASEGVNAQISVPENGFDDFKTALETIDFFQKMRLNIAAEAGGKSFFTLIVKVRPKIVADGIADPGFDPAQTGQHLDAEAWNRLMDDPDTVVVDMRNHYESEVGHFQNALTPPVATFREELPYVVELLSEQKGRKILMYCTGGIRCEKASAYLRYRGFPFVFQLDGGIIEYARQVRAKGLENKFSGKNFVFDERLGERIGPEVIARCHQCGAPCDDHANCANDHCHLLFIQCPDCRAEYENCCSAACRDFNRLPESEQKLLAKTLIFNGSRFGKGGAKAFRRQNGETTLGG